MWKAINSLEVKVKFQEKRPQDTGSRKFEAISIEKATQNIIIREN